MCVFRSGGSTGSHQGNRHDGRRQRLHCSGCCRWLPLPVRTLTDNKQSLALRDSLQGPLQLDPSAEDATELVNSNHPLGDLRNAALGGAGASMTHA